MTFVLPNSTFAKNHYRRLEYGWRMTAQARQISDSIVAAVGGQPSAAEPGFETVPPATPMAQFTLVFGRDDLSCVQVPAEINVQMVPRAGGRLAARLSGGRPDAYSAGKTQGYSICLPEAFEQAASGRMVRISLCVRSASGLNAAEFRAAYSTNEVGNSGWHRFEAGRRWQTFSFDYDVKPLQNGNGDFIGILPGGADAPAIDISYITAEVFDRA